MKVLLAPNSFKGSLSAADFCALGAKYLRGHTVRALPLADGGDGILEVFASAAFSRHSRAQHGNLVFTPAQNALGKTKKAPYLLLPGGKICVIETAKICGLGALKPAQLDALGATSRGVGQVIKAAIKKGAKTFYIGLGGVACNDGGAGMAQALGFDLLDARGRAIEPGAKGLLALRKIGPRPEYLKGVKFIGLCDVKNPLLGKQGSARVYGPQKGAGPAQVLVLERALKNLAKICARNLRKNINKPRCGAAGAIAAGLYGFLGARLVAGGPFVLDKINAVAAVKDCDAVITGEGRLDASTFYGKAPQLICALAQKYGKPVIFICGQNAIKNNAALKRCAVTKVLEIAPLAKNLEEATSRPQKYLKQILANLTL